MKRRAFLKKGTSAAIALGSVSVLTGAVPRRQANAAPPVPTAIRDPKPGEHQIVRMQRDLYRALAKPVEQRKWAMVIDARRCIGCGVQVACTAETACRESPTGPSQGRIRRVPRRQASSCRPTASSATSPVPPRRQRGEPRLDGQAFGRHRLRRLPEVWPQGFRRGPEGLSLQGALLRRGPLLDRHVAGQAERRVPTWNTARSGPESTGRFPMGAGRKCHFCLQRSRPAGCRPAWRRASAGRCTWRRERHRAWCLRLRSREKTMRVNESRGTEPRIFYIGVRPRARRCPSARRNPARPATADRGGRATCHGRHRKGRAAADCSPWSALLGGAAAYSRIPNTLRTILPAEAADGTAAYFYGKPENTLYTVCLQCNTGCGIKAKILDGAWWSRSTAAPTALDHVPPSALQDRRSETAAPSTGTLPEGPGRHPDRLRPVPDPQGAEAGRTSGRNKWDSIPFEQAVPEIVEGGKLFADSSGRGEPGDRGLQGLWRCATQGVQGDGRATSEGQAEGDDRRGVQDQARASTSTS